MDRPSYTRAECAYLLARTHAQLKHVLRRLPMPYTGLEATMQAKTCVLRAIAELTDPTEELQRIQDSATEDAEGR